MNRTSDEQGLQWQLAIRQVMTELSQLGWTVAEPKSARVDWLPEPLRRFQPDLVAVKDGEIRVFEIKSRYSDEPGKLDDLAEAVAAVPNARFDVVWVGAVVDAAGSEFTGQSISGRSSEARNLLAGGHPEAAALIAWSALEGALLNYARALRVPLPTDATSSTLPWRLLAELDSLGYLNEGDLQRISELRRQRNAAAHFAEPAAQPDPTGIEACLDIAERMHSGRYVSVDQMTDWYENRIAETEPPLGRDEPQIRQSLTGNFPGAKSSDIEQAVTELAQISEPDIGKASTRGPQRAGSTGASPTARTSQRPAEYGRQNFPDARRGLFAASYQNLMSVAAAERWGDSVLLRLIEEYLHPALGSSYAAHSDLVSGEEWRQLYESVFALQARLAMLHGTCLPGLKERYFRRGAASVAANHRQGHIRPACGSWPMVAPPLGDGYIISGRGRRGECRARLASLHREQALQAPGAVCGVTAVNNPQAGPRAYPPLCADGRAQASLI